MKARQMPKSIQKTTSLILAILFLEANLLLDFAHQHTPPDTGDLKITISPDQKKPASFGSARQLCLACLFSHNHHGVPPVISSAAISSPSFPFTPFTFHFISQLAEPPSRNRAPPVEGSVS
jgi:hypothetical protein